MISLYSCGPGRWEDVLGTTRRGAEAVTTAPSRAQHPHCSAILGAKAVFFRTEIASELFLVCGLEFGVEPQCPVLFGRRGFGV